jgi:hypothetical protein
MVREQIVPTLAAKELDKRRPPFGLTNIKRLAQLLATPDDLEGRYVNHDFTLIGKAAALRRRRCAIAQFMPTMSVPWGAIASVSGRESLPICCKSDDGLDFYEDIEMGRLILVNFAIGAVGTPVAADFKTTEGVRVILPSPSVIKPSIVISRRNCCSLRR